jgi:uncharacterized membrane protein
MTNEHDQPHAPAQSPPAAGSLSDHISQNIESVVAVQKREWESTTASQRRLERLSRLVGRPLYLVSLLLFVALWIVINSGAVSFWFAPWDPTPFQLLQGLLSLMALVTTTIVLIAQNRQTKLEQQRAHLDLQLNILTEQKVTKLIHLLEELRRDLPMVKDRHDPQAALLQEGADTAQMISALHEVGLTSDPEKGKT